LGALLSGAALTREEAVFAGQALPRMQPKPQQNYPLEKSFARRSRCVGGMTLFAVNRRCSLHDFEIICKLVKKSCALALFYLPPGGIKLRDLHF
jgi:hypothetical protein